MKLKKTIAVVLATLFVALGQNGVKTYADSTDVTNRIGDIDNDRVLTNTDLELLRNMFVNGDTGDIPYEKCDINGDGALTAKDMMLLSKWISNEKNNNYILGDVNKDGRIDSDYLDIVDILKNRSTISREDKWLADLNDDGIINRYDVYVSVHIEVILAEGKIPVTNNNMFLLANSISNNKEFMKLAEDAYQQFIK